MLTRNQVETNQGFKASVAIRQGEGTQSMGKLVAMQSRPASSPVAGIGQSNHEADMRHGSAVLQMLPRLMSKAEIEQAVTVYTNFLGYVLGERI